jgi:intracellular multiplication protein IcmE
MPADGSDPMLDQQEGDSSQIQAGTPASGKRRIDPGFSRNVKILGAVLILAIAGTTVVVLRSQNAVREAKESKLPTTVIDKGSPMSAGQSEITQPEIERIVRVGQVQSAQAAQTGQTFIPDNLPLASVPNMPDAGRGPGAGYNPQTGRHTGNPEDQQRDQSRTQGLQVQLQHLLKGLESPATQSAGPYQSKDQSGQVASPQNQPAAAAPINPVATTEDLVAGLSIHGAVLTSPLDTSKTDYISARVISGPASGGDLFGRGVVVGDEGVRVVFTKLALNGQAYDVNVVALDTQTSSNALTADIDRKLFSRYVIPIFGAIGKAYADAVARPPQQLVVSNGTVNVVTPEASAKQAAAAGVGAGIGKVTDAATYNGPNTAYMPNGAVLGILFMEPVKAKAKK